MSMNPRSCAPDAVVLLSGAVAFVLALNLYERAPMAPGAGQPRAHEPCVFRLIEVGDQPPPY